MVTCGHQFHTGDESDWLISSSATCPIDGSAAATKILRKLIKKHCKKRTEAEEFRIESSGGVLSLKKLNPEKAEKADEGKQPRTEFSFYSQPDNNHYVISQFLQDHYRQHEDGSEDEDSFLQSKSIRLTTSKEREKKLKSHRENRTKYNKGISAFYDFANFDESQHLDGCPVKWLYRKKSVESLRGCKASCKAVPKSNEAEEKRRTRGRSGNFRDRTPIEIKIRKMNLKKKDSFEEVVASSGEETRKSSKKGRKPLDRESEDVHKKKLAAKLNWKPFVAGEEDGNSEVSSDKSARDGYLPPRPLLGLRPLLSILLSPRQESSCCSVGAQLAQNMRHEDRSQSASLSIKSLDLPSLNKISKSNNSRPRALYAQRWGSKTSKFQKKLQTPTQITIKLRQIQRKPAKDVKEDSNSNDSSVGVKKTNDNKKYLKYSHSLTSLCYELGNKANCDNTQDYFEQMIRELATEDKDFRIKRFLNSNNMVKMQDKSPTGKKLLERKKSVSENEQVVGPADEEQFQIICTKVQFFERPGKPMK